MCGPLASSESYRAWVCNRSHSRLASSPGPKAWGCSCLNDEGLCKCELDFASGCLPPEPAARMVRNEKPLAALVVDFELWMFGDKRVNRRQRARASASPHRQGIDRAVLHE